MPKFTLSRGNLNEHDPWFRHRLAYNMDLWSFSYTYAVNTMNINQTIDGIKTFLNFPILPFDFPELDEEATNKLYVDYTAKAAVTFENLSFNGDVGEGANQVAVGNHTHVTLPTQDQKDAMDTAQDPSASNPFVTFDQFADHSVRHEANGPDEISLTGLSGGPVTINGVFYTVTVVNSSPYSVVSTDVHLSVDTTDNIVINLPAINSSNDGRYLMIKDATNNAGIKNIAVTPYGTDQIDMGGAGVPFYILFDSDGIVIVANNTTKNWELVSSDKGRFKVLEVSGTTSLSYYPADEIIILCDTTLAGFTINLPNLTEVRSRVMYSIVNIGSSNNSVIIDGYSGDTIDGELTQDLLDGSSMRLIATTNGWFIL